jgi:hypothetical protein
VPVASAQTPVDLETALRWTLSSNPGLVALRPNVDASAVLVIHQFVGHGAIPELHRSSLFVGRSRCCGPTTSGCFVLQEAFFGSWTSRNRASDCTAARYGEN